MGRGLWGVVVSFLLLWACKSDPVDTENPDNKKPDPSTFGFTLLKITDVKEISVERLKKQLKSESGWTIKSIKIDDESFAEVTGSLPNLKIILKKSGSFTASITLQKKGWQDFVLKDCKIQVVLPQFSFSKFTQNKSKKTITSAEILKQIAGAQAAGYSIKSIVVSDENFAKVSGTAPKLQIDIQKVGKFTATIVLSHKSFFEITLKDCAFEIVPEFIFSRLTRSISGAKTITAAQILGQITGAAAAGYTIKSIVITEDTKKLATVKNDTSIDFTKEGVFKATIILKKDQHSDITLTDCAFVVSAKKAAPTLTFTKLSRKFSTAPITKAEILKQIKQDITGWTLKNVVLSNASFGDVDSNFSIRLKKIGNFSATLTFERAGYVSAQVTGSFEITKGLAASLKFTKLTRSFKGDKIITAARILGQIANVKTWGYALKSIDKISDTDIAAANGTQITIKKVGTFTAELILESANYEDARVQASFEVSGKNTPPVLSFAALKRNYSGSKTITKAQILNQITATSGQADWAGYVLKSIVLTENVSLARVNNSKFEITILKAGTFKARLTFTRDSYVDAIVTGTFEIGKVAAPSLKFTTFTKKFGGSNTISKTEILGKITGDKTGYVLKSIVPSNVSFASVSAAFEMTLRRAGNFTATITLSRENYEDAVIKNCSFKIAPGDAPTDLRLTAFARKFSDSRTITAADILAKISGKKDGYVLKSISINSGNDVATVSGTKPVLQINIQKAGTFTADIVLERANYKDATIANVIFTIQKAAAPTGLSFTKLKKVFGQTITAADILANVKGSGKTGYTLKSIAITSGGDVAALSGLKEIVSKKSGTFKATLVLERANYEDATINDANFKIIKGTAAKLTFDELTKPFGETITAANILTNVKGSGKTGYTLKSIAITSGGDVAALTGGSKAIVSKKVGTFKATLVLEHKNYLDVTLSGCDFEIVKGTAAKLTFDKLTKRLDWTITEKDILKNVQGIGKTGYTLKALTGISDSTVAELSGAKAFTIKKLGAFTANILLENPNYQDVRIPNCNFEYAVFQLVVRKNYGGIVNDVSVIIQTSDGGFAIAGKLSNKCGILKFDDNGNQQWVKEFTNDNRLARGNFIVQATDGSYFLAGWLNIRKTVPIINVNNRFYMVKVDSNAEKDWDKISASSSTGAANSAIQSTDGGFVVVGEEGSKGFVTKLNNTGSTLWTKIFSSSLSLKTIKQTTDGGFIVGGSALSSKVANAYVVKLNSSGGKSWEKILKTSSPSKVGSLLQTTDGGFIVVENTGRLIKLNSSGDKSWEKPPLKTGTVSSRLLHTIDGGFFLVSSRISLASGIKYFYTISKLDSSGKELSHVDFEKGNALFFADAVLTTDGNLLVVSSDDYDFIIRMLSPKLKLIGSFK